jgi:7-cyano-7-deazaguanine reductase
VTDPTLPLGQKSDYPNKYQPDVLFAIARGDDRDGELPFGGIDIWNAWDLTWLGPGDLPVVVTAQIRIPATSPNLIESKSLKLYLGSFAMSRFDSPVAVAKLIATDIGKSAGQRVSVQIQPVAETTTNAVSVLPGICLDSIAVTCSSWKVDPELLSIAADEVVEEALHSHLLRSLCPVTGQPDVGSVAIHYRGPRIDHASLLKYIVSFREHDGFHEACVEQMFVDLLAHCKVEKLSIYARYQRRGGIDINPFRSNFEDPPQDLRLWRQ